MATRAKIFVLDDSEDLRSLFQQLVHLMLGEECLCLATLRELEANAGVALAAKAAFLDINLGPGEPNGVEVLSWLRQRGFAGRVFFLTGHAANHPAVTQARQTGVRVLTKPLPAAELVALVREALAAGGSA
jgi:DNA-binding NtrC family response regulator